MAELTTVYHPTIPDNSREVENPAAWVKQGWLKSEPSNEVVTTTRKATAKAQRADAKAFATSEDVTPGVTDVPPVDASVHGPAVSGSE